MPIILIYISAGMILLGVAHLPYDYYILLRFVAFSVFSYAAFLTLNRTNKALPWIYGSLALLFNPFMLIHFPKEVWIFIDIVAAGVLITTAKKITKSHIN